MKKERIEHKYVKHIRQLFKFPFIHDKFINGDNCVARKPDLFWPDARLNCHIILEIDEREHRSNNGDYSCDEARIFELWEEFRTAVPKHFVVIRLNPDGYSKNHSDRSVVFKDRLAHVVDILKQVRERPPPGLMSIVYMYYSPNNSRISKNIPHYMLDDFNRELNY